MRSLLWHEHHEVRRLILAARVHDLPGLSESARLKLANAQTFFEQRVPRGERRSPDEWWPRNVSDLVRKPDAKMHLRNTPQIGPATLTSLEAAMRRLGLDWGMQYRGEGWRDYWHPDFMAQRAKGIRIEDDDA